MQQYICISVIVVHNYCIHISICMDTYTFTCIMHTLTFSDLSEKWNKDPGDIAKGTVLSGSKQIALDCVPCALHGHLENLKPHFLALIAYTCHQEKQMEYSFLLLCKHVLLCFWVNSWKHMQFAHLIIVSPCSPSWIFYKATEHMTLCS